MRALFLALAILAAASGSDGRIVAVVDGDTLKVAVEIWSWPRLERVRTVRLLGIDAPELRGHCRAERARAQAARAALLPFVGRKVTLTEIAADKYPSRIDARVRLRDGRDLSEWLLAQGLARTYAGGVRVGWCD